MWQCVWGLPQTLAGLALLLVLRRRGMIARTHAFHGAIACEWTRGGGVSLGLFVFVPAKTAGTPVGDLLLLHEYGHTIQSLLLGPLYLLIVGLPSFIWANAAACKRYRTKSNKHYEAFYTEKWATCWGQRAMRCIENRASR